MTMHDLPTPDEIRKQFSEAINAHRKFFLAQGIILIVLGMLAIGVPLISSFAVAILVGWLFFIGGIVRTVTLLGAKHLPGFWWSLLGSFLAGPPYLNGSTVKIRKRRTKNGKQATEAGRDCLEITTS